MYGCLSEHVRAPLEMLIGSIVGQCQKGRACICNLKDMQVVVSQLFLPGVQQFIERQVHLLTANRMQVYALKANKRLVSCSLFLSQKPPRLLSPRRMSWARQDWFHDENPSFLSLQSQWQLRPPQGKLINYSWMFDWQRLNDRSSVLTWLPHTENLVPVVFFKTCQMITDKLLFAWRVELSFCPF